MHVQYPPNTTRVFSYIESRGGIWNETVFFGLQVFLKEYLSNPITLKDVEEAKAVIEAHGEPFNYEGWKYIVDRHKGKLPVKIKAVKEGSVIPTKNVLVTIENTDPNCFWLTTFLETALLRAVWYPTTVATVSYEIKKLIKEYLNETGDPSLIDFKLHDFGARGVSSEESAMLGGMAHLVNFKGTDTVSALVGARRYYNEPCAGFSIPAMEHSTVTSWGKDNEAEAYRNMVEHYAGPGKIYACVSDSYDIYNAVSNIWGGELKEQVIEKGGTVVIRPDSGDPATVVLDVVRRLDLKFGSETNSKGYKVLHPSVRVIQGDGINHASIRSILFTLKLAGYSADNVTFGMGGALLQHMNRDTLKWAMKCSAIEVAGEWRDVFKDPVTDQEKKSKKGRMVLVCKNNLYQTITTNDLDYEKIKHTDILQVVFEDGNLIVDQSFNDIRRRIQL